MPTLITIREPDGNVFNLAIDGAKFAVPDGAVDEQIETGHLWALPGLADAHAHLTMTSLNDIGGMTDDDMRANIPVNAWAHVERGVLLILDKGGNSDTTLVSLDHDADLRPYIETAGAMIHPDQGYMKGFGAEVEPEDLVSYIATSAATRGGWVKIVADWPRRGVGPTINYPLDVLTEAVSVAHDAGVRVAVHTMAHGASEAVAAGVDSIEHGPFLTEEDLSTLAARGGAWVPTIGNQKHWIDALGLDSSGGKMFKAGLDRMAENLPLAEELGLTVLAGSDLAIPHGHIAGEAILLRDHGLTDKAATIAASSGAFEYVGRGASLNPGNTADVVFFADNPYDEVAVLARPELIIRRGNVVASNF